MFTKTYLCFVTAIVILFVSYTVALASDYIVAFDVSVSEINKAKIIKDVSGTIIKDLDIIGAKSVNMPDNEVAKLRKIPGVLRVTIDSVIKLEPSIDRKIMGQSPQSVPWGVDRIGAKSLGRIVNRQVKIAVLDTGIDLTHPDLQENIAGGINIADPAKPPMDTDGHGTHVAGIIGAVNNDIGILGVAPKVSLYAVKVFNDQKVAFYSDIIAGLEWSLKNKIQIVNMSFGGYVDDPNIREAINKVYNAGIFIVASAGNGKSNKPEYPASLPGVISVSATDNRDRITQWSNFGTDVDLSAPGVGIPSTYLNGGYAVLSGTDMAAAHVTGALAISVAAEVDSSKIEEAILEKAEDLGARGRDDLYGYGLVDATRTAYMIWWLNPMVVTAKATPLTGFSPLLVVFSADVKGGPPTKPVFYKWDFESDKVNDFTNVISAETAHTYIIPGIYKATVEITDFLGKKATSWVIIKADTLLSIITPFGVEAIVDPPKGRTTQTFSFSAKINKINPLTTPRSYEWDFESDGVYDYNSTTSADTTHKYDSAGTYEATVRVTDLFGLTAKDRTSVEVAEPISVTLSVNPAEGFTTDSFKFTAIASGDSSAPISYDWNFGDEKTDSTKTAEVQHLYASPGTYTTTVTVTDSWGGDGGTATASVNAVVKNPFSVTLSANLTRAHTLEDVTFTAVPKNGIPPINYTWDFNGDGTFEQSSGANPVIVNAFSDPGIYTVSVKATDSQGSATATTQVDIKPPLGVTLSADHLRAYTNMDIRFTANPSGGFAPVTYSWDFNNDGTFENSSGTSSSIIHSYPAPGIYTIGVKAVDDIDGIRGTTTATIQVEILQAIEVALSADPVRAHTDDNITFTATTRNGAPPITFQWDYNGDGVFEETSGVNNITVHSYPSGGLFAPKVKAVDSIGFAIASTAVNIAPPLIINLTADPTRANNGQYIKFTAVTTGGFEPIKYEWDFNNDGTVDYRSSTYDYDYPPNTIPFADHAYPVGGIYTCVVNAVDDIDGTKGKATSSAQVTVVEPLRVSLSSSSAANRVRDEFTFTADATGGVPPITFEWDLDGIAGYEYSSGTNPTAKRVYNNPGTYWPIVRATDSIGTTIGATTRVDVTAAMSVNFSSPTSNSKFHVNCEMYFFVYVNNAYAPVNYEWDLNSDGIMELFTGTDYSFNHTFTTPGIYNITVKATDSKGGGGGTAIALVTIQVLPPLAVNIIAEPSQGVIPININFIAQPQNVIGNPDFDWDLDGNGSYESTSQAVPNISRNYTTVGVKKVTVRLFDESPCGVTYASTWINVYDVPSDYVFMTKWGACSQYSTDFSNPFGLSIDKQGYIYVAEYEKEFIARYGPQGYYTSIWYNKDNQPEQFFNPIDVAHDSFGRTFVLNTGNPHVSIYDYKGTFIKKWDLPGMTGLLSIAIDGLDNVYIGTAQEKCIRKFDLDGNPLGSWGDSGTADGEIQYPTGIAVDSAGNVYVADDPTGRVQKFDKDGNLLKKFGEADADYGNPYDVTLDKDGNIFVSYAYGVKKFDSNCDLITKWGGRGSANGQFNGARGIAVDDLGYVYVLDKGNCRIQKFRKGPVVLHPLTVNIKTDRSNVIVGDPVNFTADFTGTPINFAWKFEQGAKPDIEPSNHVTPDLNYEPLNSCYDIKATLTIKDDFGREASDSKIVTVTNQNPYNFVRKWGSEGTGDGQFNGALGGMLRIAYSKSGYIYVSDTNNHRIQKFDLNGNFILKWGGVGTNTGKFSSPKGIAVDGSGNVFVADSGNKRVQKFDANGNFIKEWKFTNETPVAIAVDKFGNVYFVTEYYGSYIQKFDNNLNFIKNWAGQYINDIAIDSLGNVYATSNDYDKVYKYNSEGILLKKWGASGPNYDFDKGSYYGFSWANGICIDDSDYVYIVDTGNYRVMVFDSDGNFITFWGCYGNQDGHFTKPMDVAIDDLGFAYVTDPGVNEFNNDTRVQKFEPEQPRTAPGRNGFEKLANLLSKPVDNRLMQNYPNPFNPETWIPFQLKEDSEVKVTIFDVSGRLVCKLDLGYKPAGVYASRDKSVYWDGRNEIGERVSSGVYFYMIETKSFRDVKKMTIMK